MTVKFWKGYCTFYPETADDSPQLSNEPRQVFTMSIGEALKYANISLSPKCDVIIVHAISPIDAGTVDEIHYPWSKSVYKRIIRDHARRILNYHYWITIKNHQS